ncbi:hypothetical protein [Stygiobacter electus]|uniref:Nuclear transport factor 2 family protein n=1 Tax=Stygiobacter electus TaxID=3032292 RepID=A0AAE3TDZ0_9BACT|nr:hypothetical protein [Stygiobacter electus]MDF1612976.1 hypothetical protein [Stygiobacter electus]
MKYLLQIFLLFLFTMTLIAQDSENEVKKQLNKLIELSKSKNYDKAALLIAYNGEIKERVNKDSFDPTKKNELEKVKRICKKISALIDLSSKYEISNYYVDKNNPEIHIVEITFTSGTQNLVTQFSFIRNEKGFLLTNMN